MEHDLHHRLELPPEPTAGAVARAFLTHALSSTLPSSVLDGVLLAASELVTNAVRHGAGSPRLELRCDPGTVRVEVTDDGDGSQVDPARFGLGLSLVAEVTDRMGSESTGSHSVWFEMAADGARREDA